MTFHFLSPWRPVFHVVGAVNAIANRSKNTLRLCAFARNSPHLPCFSQSREGAKSAKKSLRMDLKKRIWEILEVDRPGDERGRVFDAFDIFILALILLNVIAAILGTVKSVEARFQSALRWFEVFSVVVFTIEYLARVWACVSQIEYSPPVVGRLRFMLRPIAIIDLLAVLPFYLTFVTADLRFLRALRLFRLFRVAKLGRYSSSIRLFGRVFRNKKDAFLVTMLVMLLMIIMSSSFLYLAESEVLSDDVSDIYLDI